MMLCYDGHKSRDWLSSTQCDWVFKTPSSPFKPLPCIADDQRVLIEVGQIQQVVDILVVFSCSVRNRLEFYGCIQGGTKTSHAS